jgi:hypothetical protein
MSTTRPEQPRNETVSRQSQPGRTAGNRWLLALGALVVGATAIESVLKALSGVLKGLGGVVQEAESLSEIMSLPRLASWIALVGLAVYRDLASLSRQTQEIAAPKATGFLRYLRR